MRYIIFIIILSSGFFSCRRPFANTDNLMKVDTLESRVTEIDNTLILDENVFSQRLDSMNTKLQVIHSKMKVDSATDTGEAVLRYEGIGKNYQDFLKNYPVMEYDESAFQKSVKAFKQSVLDHKVSQQEFDAYYHKTKPQLDNLLSRAKTMTYNTVAIEHDYGRTNPVVTGLAEKLQRSKK